MLIIVATIAVVLTLLVAIYVIRMHFKSDGRLVIDESQDLWSIVITAPIETIKRKKHITLDVKKIR